jgi:hypothetical protein
MPVISKKDRRYSGWNKGMKVRENALPVIQDCEMLNKLEMVLFTLSVVLSPRRRLYEPEAAGFRLRRTIRYASAKTFVRPSSAKKFLISR